MSGILNIRDPNTGKFTPVTAIAGVGVPAKGTTGQILTKISDADYDTQWKENDASKLGGKAPEEYATAESVSQLKDEKANKSIVSDAWQSGKTYNAGAYCIYNNSLYKALVQTTAEPTSNTDWTECTIADEIIAITPKNTEHKVLTTDYGSIIFFAHDKVVSFYAALSNMPTNNSVDLGYVPVNPPNYNYGLFPTFYGDSPYIPIGSIWIYSDGKITLFKNNETTSAYVFGTYVSNN